MGVRGCGCLACACVSACIRRVGGEGEPNELELTRRDPADLGCSALRKSPDLVNQV